MTNRTVAVSLILQAQGYMQGMKEVGKATDEAGSKAEKLAAQRQGFETLGRAAIGFGAAVGLGVGIAIGKWAEFDQQMSYVQAATHETAANMGLLKDAALEAGARTVYSATEAAGAIEELARAGVSTQDILSGGLDAALDLAAAGGLAVADAAGIAAVALKTFNLEGKDMSHVADLLAAGAGKAMGDVSQLSQALAQGGQVAKQTGLSIEETTAGLAAFASQGLLGSDAGTSFKSMLQRLTPQSNEAKQKMDALGISAYDASGNFIGLAEFAGNLQGALRSLTPEQRNSAMATIFGSDAVRAATVLYDEGESGIRNWIDAVNDQGYAAETAAMRLDNLMGDWEAFTGALDTAFITMGEGADGPLRSLVQGLTGLVDGFNALPDGAQQAVMWVGLVTAGVALTGGAALLAVPKIAAFQVGLQTLGITAAGTRAGLGRVASFLGGPWGIALVAATALMMTYNRVVEEGIPTQEAIANKILSTADASDKLAAAVGQNKFFPQMDANARGMLDDLPALLDQASEAADNWFIGLMKSSTASDQAYEALGRYGDALAGLASTDLPAASAAFAELVNTYDLTDKQALRLLEQMPALKNAFIGAADGQDLASDSAALLQFAMGELPGPTSAAEAALVEMQTASEEAKDAFDAAASALKGIGDTAMSLGEAKDAALTAINALTEAAAAEGATLDGTNAASIRLRDAVRDVETSHKDAAVAIIENGGTLAEAQAEYDKSRDAIIGMLTAKGMDAAQAAIWADAQLGASSEVKGGIDQIYQAWLNMPENKETKYKVEAAEAATKLANLKAMLDAIPNHKYTQVTLTSYRVDGGKTVSIPDNASGNLYTKGKKVTSFASGAMVPGIYSPVAGGIHRMAEAGWSEAYITENPAYRDHSLDVWEGIGRRIGAFQPAPASHALAAAATSSRAAAAPQFSFGDIYGIDPELIVGEINQQVRRAVAVSGLHEGVGD